LYAGGTRPLDGYTIKRGVGQGGFGEIYYAVSDSGKEVALKLIRRNLEVELRGIRQCLNLKHPNLLHLFDIRQDDNGDNWVVMEFVGGLSLQDAIDAQPNGMPVEEAMAWMHGIAGAVAYLHDRGIVHRDLKPANIFSDDGVVKVGDYGLSKFISCSRRSGHTESIGTVHYMAPEVANGRYGKEIDVYALGIILYELLTGRVPFDGESVGEVLMKHLTAQPDISVLAEPYRSIAAKAMEKDPELRYRSANEFLAALPPLAAVPPSMNRLPSGSQASARPAWEEEPGAKNDNRETFVNTAAVEAEIVDDEPILRALRTNWAKAVERWDRATPSVKALIITGGIFAMLAFWQIFIAGGIALAIIYGIYRFVRMIVISTSDPGGSHAAKAKESTTPPELAKTVAAPSAGEPAAAAPSIRKREPWRPTREVAALALVVRSPKERVADLLGSMLLSTLIVATMTVVMAFVFEFHGSDPAPSQLCWLFFVGVAGSWGVLVPSKIWEGSKGESMPRRFVMMVLGLAVGAFACGLANWFMVDLPHNVDYPILLGSTLHYKPASFFANDGRPLLAAFAVVFGGLFLLLRWWGQADPLRSTRLSVWSLVVSVTLAFVVAGLLHFPQPWLMMIAATISMAVQLSSPWIPPKVRAAMRRTP
jgi:hypothetical protein